MDKKLGLLLILIAFSCCFVFVWASVGNVKASDAYPVYNIDTGLGYPTIQSAIDAQQTVDGHTILVGEGIYYEHLIVHKSISIIGENRTTTIIDGNGTGTVVLVTAVDVTVKEFSVQNGNVGIDLDHSNDSLIAGNDVFSNADGIDLSYCYNCTIRQNIVKNNGQRGIFVTNSWNFEVNSNEVSFNGWYGINANASTNGLIAGNIIQENYFDGIGLLQSRGCVVSGNNVNRTTLLGIWIESSSNNLIYHNNFIRNGIQAGVSVSTCVWDDGAEGNYWSNYTGVDHNGVGDLPHIIDVNDTDHYPLMGMFYNFNTSLSMNIAVVSNSTIDSFTFFGSNLTIKMYLSNMSSEQTQGFCRLTIFHSVMAPLYNVTVNDSPVSYATVYENGTLSIIYFSYDHSKLKIAIVPGYPIGAMTVRVIDWLGNGISNVNVTALQHSSNRTLCYATHDDGYVVFTLPLDAYDVSATVDGHLLTESVYHDGNESIVVLQLSAGILIGSFFTWAPWWIVPIWAWILIGVVIVLVLYKIFS
jgi:parallel beta-helix repeat protein